MQNQYKCSWCKGDNLYEKYHDTEWGVPVFDDQALFEFLTLETFQAGLSWITVLRKRPEFRKAFDQFNYHKILHYNSQKEKELMNNSSIIRNRLKISATIQNANAFIEIQSKKGSFSNYLWEFVNGSPKINVPVLNVILWKSHGRVWDFNFSKPSILFNHSFSFSV